LVGLKFRSAQRAPAPEKGDRDLQVKKERPLRPSDVLDWRETDTHVHIVASDGQKYTVAK
jgi:urease accessory protein UreE